MIFNSYVLAIFNIHGNIIALILLIFAMSKHIIYTCSMGLNILFQAVGQTVRGSIVAMTHNLICFVPVSFIMFGISIVTKQEMVYLASPLVSMAVSAIVWNVWMVIYQNKYLSLTSYDKNVIWMRNKGYFKPINK